MKIRVIAISIALTATLSPSAQAAPNYTFPIQGCSYTYAKSHHNYPATDILAKNGCAFVAPTSGVVDEVNRVDRFTWKTNKGADRGGLSISMIGDDGVRYYGSHLSFIPRELEHGVRINVGEMLGKTGNSGDAKGTAPHVHFGVSWPTPAGIWWVRRGELYPWKYLDAWKAGRDLSPLKAVKALEKKFGTVPKQVGY
jgi:murein DD-endopeptidase MepM/ murein hydrolase activator NlpD